jgi:HKD family nuclease
MKNYLLYFSILFLLSSGAVAQNQPVPEAPPILQGIKIAFITKQLALSNEEAQKFWPLYYEFSDKAKSLKKDQNLDELAFDQKILEEKKKLKVELTKVLGSENRANKALGVDREFNQILKKELDSRRAMQQKMDLKTDKQLNLEKHADKQQQKMENHVERQQQKLEKHTGPKT